jgi:hypothetical protein
MIEVSDPVNDAAGALAMTSPFDLSYVCWPAPYAPTCTIFPEARRELS